MNETLQQIQNQSVVRQKPGRPRLTVRKKVYNIRISEDLFNEIEELMLEKRVESATTALNMLLEDVLGHRQRERTKAYIQSKLQRRNGQRNQAGKGTGGNNAREAPRAKED